MSLTESQLASLEKFYDDHFGYAAQQIMVGGNTVFPLAADSGKDSYYATSGGFAEISKQKVQFLLETVESSKEIDLDRAKSSMQRSKDRLSKKGDNDINRAELSLTKALNRLKVSNR